MSLMYPPYDDLLSSTDHNRFRLCVVVSKRAKQVRKLQQEQMQRAILLQQGDKIAKLATRNALSIAMAETYSGELKLTDPEDLAQAAAAAGDTLDAGDTLGATEDA